MCFFLSLSLSYFSSSHFQQTLLNIQRQAAPRFIRSQRQRVDTSNEVRLKLVTMAESFIALIALLKLARSFYSWFAKESRFTNNNFTYSHSASLSLSLPLFLLTLFLQLTATTTTTQMYNLLVVSENVNQFKRIKSGERNNSIVRVEIWLKFLLFLLPFSRSNWNENNP